MRSVTEAAPATIAELRALAPARFGDMMKAVVDLERPENRSRGIDDPAIRQRVAALVEGLVRR